MKKTVFIFLILATFNLCGQTFVFEDLNLKGNIKKISQIDYTVTEKNGKIKKKDTIEYSERKQEFDTQKRILKMSYYFIYNPVFYVYVYNDKGLLIEEKRNEGKHEYEYDDNANIVSELMYDSEGLFGSWHYKYDKNNNRIERLGLYDRSYAERWIVKYDKENRKIKEYMVGEDDTIPTTMFITFEYDYKNRLRTKKSTNPATNVYAIDIYKYNEKDDLIEHYSKNDFQTGEEEVRTFKYYYDKKGNWVKRIAFYNSKARTITEREIEYW